MNKKLIKGAAMLTVALTAMVGCKGKANEDELKIRNLYFSAWEGDDPYTRVIEEKFNVKITPSSYDYNSWGSQVVNTVNAMQIGDVFHFDLESFNFGNTYLEWANGGIIKALPDNMTKWPKLKALIDNASNIDYLKIDGKLYGIPLAYNTSDYSKDFSSFTYLYRRDWLKEIDAAHEGESGYPLLRDNDVYTWEEFLNIINEFKTKAASISSDYRAIGDVSWGFPSLTNFYKNSPHCYSVKPDGSVENTFTSDAYRQGIELTRSLIDEMKYYQQSAHTKDTKAYDSFKSGQMGIYYENLSLGNYTTLRKDIKDIVPGIGETALNDRTAIMKVKGPDGKFHLEGSENWYSMTFFNADMTDSKQERILDIMEFLLGEEGTNLAIYGKENQDYVMRDGEPELLPDSWVKKPNGEYASKVNGAKYLRQMVTLNYDTTNIDPFTDQKSYQIINAWQNDMKAAKASGNLVTFQEPPHIKWMSTTLKDRNTSGFINTGNDNAMNFCYRVAGYDTWDSYYAQFQTADWVNTINEVNRALGH